MIFQIRNILCLFLGVFFLLFWFIFFILFTAFFADYSVRLYHYLCDFCYQFLWILRGNGHGLLIFALIFNEISDLAFEILIGFYGIVCGIFCETDFLLKCWWDLWIEPLEWCERFDWEDFSVWEICKLYFFNLFVSESSFFNASSWLFFLVLALSFIPGITSSFIG